MKKIITMVMALSAGIAVNAQTQIGNSGFESWETVSGESEPVNWNSFISASGSMATFAANQIQETSDIRPGSTGTKSARIWSRSVLGIVANGNVTLGRINMGSSSPSDANNYNRSIITDTKFSEVMTERPDSIVFWVKFTPNGHSQNARVKASIHDNHDYRDPEDAASSGYVVGKAELNFPSTAGQWVRKSIPFDYSGPATTASFILITFTTNQTPGGGASNDQMWIDDVELIYVPKASFTTSAVSVCEGSTVTYTNTSTNYPATYSWSFPGGTPATSTSASPTVTYNTAGTYNVVLTATNQWGSNTVTMTNHVAVNQVADAAFNYSAANYCSNISNPVPTAVSAGTFSSSTGLTFANTSTGEIDLDASTPGTYTITHTTLGTCPSTATSSVTIFQGADASFSYSTNTICISGGNQTPTVTEAGGTFSSDPTGLVFANASTGEIDVTASTSGTYAISYVRGGGCPDTVTTNITLTSTPDATFSYNQNAYCLNASNDPNPVFGTGANAGVFSSTTGLSINANTGVVDVSASTPGSYVVTNDIAAAGTCPAATHTANITINDIPAVALTLAQSTVCSYNPSFLLSGGTPAGGTYTGSGVLANIFNPASVPVGSVSTITYTYTNTSTSCSNFATASLAVDACASIENTETAELISVYPNPTNGIIKVGNVTESAVYTVISISGQVVQKGELSSNKNTIDLSAAQNGIYLLQLQQGENTQTVRIVKQ